jgi:hypothetical protein
MQPHSVRQTFPKKEQRMRKFTSYEAVNTKLHYYALREELIDRAYDHLLGEDPTESGHYITVWAPRQSGKTWLMRQVVERIKARDDFEVAILTMQSGKTVKTDKGILGLLLDKLRSWFGRELPDITLWTELNLLFSIKHFTKPLILILDEFDSLSEDFINKFANEFREMYTHRVNEVNKPSREKTCLLHGLALIGVRSVLGIENITGSPFNVQRSVHIPNLTFEEVDGMFKWYERESGQQVEQAVIDRLFYETQGQPGLVGWFGELLTETYNKEQAKPLTMENFEEVYAEATDVLPNNNILNIISKAKQETYKSFVLEMFKTSAKIRFRYDHKKINFLYLNGVIGREKVGRTENYVKFSCPFVQKRLFNYFSDELFPEMGRLYDPLDDLSDTITEDSLNIENLLKRYGQYLHQNRHWLLKNAPRRADLRIYEAVYHFNLYKYLLEFFKNKKGTVYPEFPTGNGQIDLLIRYRGQMYGLEVKSLKDKFGYEEALEQAVGYGQRLGLPEVTLAFFIEAIDDENRCKYEAAYVDEKSGLRVKPVFVEVGSQ